MVVLHTGHCPAASSGVVSLRGLRILVSSQVTFSLISTHPWAYGREAASSDPPRGSHTLPPQVLETCMKSCGKRFHDEVGKFRFLNELIKVVSPKVGAPSPGSDLHSQTG